MVGLIEDLSLICGQAWQSDGDLIYLIGSQDVTLGASQYLKTIHNLVVGRPPRVDFPLEKTVQSLCRKGIVQGWVKSAHDCSEGGLAVALAESSISAGKGALINLNSQITRADLLLFGEGTARIIVSISPEFQAAWESLAQEELNKSWHYLGKVGGDKLTIKSEQNSLIDLEVNQLKNVWSQAIPRRLEIV
jgi:phosphoribosylformylglycinamidine synthase